VGRFFAVPKGRWMGLDWTVGFRIWGVKIIRGEGSVGEL